MLGIRHGLGDKSRGRHAVTVPSAQKVGDHQRTGPAALKRLRKAGVRKVPKNIKGL